MPSRPGRAPWPPAIGLVVHPAAPAEDDVVHRALAGGADPAGQGLGQRAEADVGHPLAHLDVAGRHRRRRQGGDDGARQATTTRTGRSEPALAGIVGSTAARTANATALTVTASTALTLPGCCGSVPVKSNVSVVARLASACRRCAPGAAARRRRRSSRGRRSNDHGPSGDGGEGGAHPPLAVVEHLGERGAGGHEGGEPGDADDVGADLGVEVAGPLAGACGCWRGSIARTAVVEHARAAAADPPAGSRWRRPASSRARRRRRRRGGRGWRPSRRAGRRRGTASRG